MKANQKTQSGFTVIEVVIVAAIIGILGAMGATAYQKFSAKAKQRQGKLYLSNGFLAQRTFFAEHLSFSHCLRQMKGLPGDPLPGGPGGDNRPYYYGFANGSLVDNCGPAGTQSCNAFAFSPQQLCSCPILVVGGSNDCGADSTVRTAIVEASAYVWIANQTQFTMGIVGFVSDTNVADIWTINQDKQLVMIQNGL
jgi:prepilin-type N-terminal cleavage/methylation domain-containing protein